MNKKFLIIFSALNFLAFCALLVYKFVNAPVHVKVERTSIMNVEEKKELVSAVLSVISNNLPRIGSNLPTAQFEPRPIQINGKIYQSGGNYFYYLDGFSFAVGEIFPLDSSPIVDIYKLSLVTEKGRYYVHNSPVSSPSSSSASSSSLSQSSKSPFSSESLFGGGVL